MKPYLELTQRGKAQRLSKLAENALRDYDLDVARIRLIANDFNCIFRIDTHDKQKYILRVTLPDGAHTPTQTRSEMMWLNALANDTDINVPIPVPTKSGDWVTTASTDDVPQARHCAVFSWVPGVDIGERRSPETWQLFGRLSAKLHQSALNFTPPQGFDVVTHDIAYPFHADDAMFNDRNRHYFTNDQISLIHDAIERIQADIDRMYTQDMAGLRVTHGDLHQWNVRIYRNTLSPIDFEDVMWSYPIQDIGIAMYYNRDGENFGDLLAGFKAGYETIAPFPEEYAGQLEIHMLARRINLLNYVFASEEDSIDDYPDFIPRTEAHIKWVREHIWKQS